MACPAALENTLSRMLHCKIAILNNRLFDYIQYIKVFIVPYPMPVRDQF